MQRKTKTLITLIPLSLLALWLDALEPGWGKFYNPMFWGRSQLAKLDTSWREQAPLDAAHPLLQPCQQFISDTVLSEAQEQARSLVTGQSESFALQQLGAPTCAIAEQTFRWISVSGLAIDVTFEDGVATDAKLSR
jgi:hypothetical protein